MNHKIPANYESQVVLSLLPHHHNSRSECDPKAPSIQKGEELNGNARN